MTIDELRANRLSTLSCHDFVGFLTLARGLAAEGNSSLSESNIENADTKVTAAAMLSQNEELRRQLSLARESVKTLTDSLAASNAEAEVFRRKYSDLQLRMEALGLEAASKDRAKLEQRLLSAVSDLRLMQKEREKYRDQVLGLSEAMLHLLKTSHGRRCAGADGSGSAIAQRRVSWPRSRRVSPEETATLDGRQGGQREGRVVAGGGQYRGKAGSEDRDAAAGDAGG